MKRPLRSILLILLFMVSALLISLGAIVWIALADLPDIETLKYYEPPQSTMVLDRNGELVGRFFDERRTVISLKKLPMHVKLAFIAAEDGDFFEHRGIDYFGLMRAILLEIKYKTVGGRRVGGSTITQQTARTMLLSSTQTYVRKVKEIALAQRIENALSKDEILHLYLNQIYFGNGAYGIEEAAQTYFLKPAAKLTLSESATLASIPKSPNRINPFSDAERLKHRQHYVLDQMVRLKFIEAKDGERAKSLPIFSDVADGSDRPLAPYFLRSVKVELLRKVSDEVIRRGGLKVYSTLDAKMQKVAEDAMTSGLRALDKQYGYRGPVFRPGPTELNKLNARLLSFKKSAFIAENAHRIWDLSRFSKESVAQNLNQAIDSIRLTKFMPGKVVGVLVVSVNDQGQAARVDLGSRMATLPFSRMSWAQPIGKQGKRPLTKVSDVIKAGDIVLVKLHGPQTEGVVSLEQEPEINGGLVALDAKTGAVRAMVGGYDFERSPFNRITQAKRQPGSGIKPLVYGLAIDRELTTAATRITDAPKAFLDPGTNEFWRPRNHTNEFLGDITVRRCLRSSINICTITLLEMIGIDNFLQFAKAVNLNTAQTPYPRNLTIALGSAENYPIDVANAMRILANNGIYSDYYLLDAVKYANGQQEKLHEPQEKVVLRPESTFIITNILKDVVNQSKQAQLENVRSDLAGKTGTTNNARSTWFFGYSPEVIALVYVGFDDNRSIGADAWGRTTAKPIWEQFMNGVPYHQEAHRFSVPENIEWSMIDRDTGHPLMVDPFEMPPENAMMEAFIRGTVPQTAIDVNPHTVSPDSNDEAAFAP